MDSDTELELALPDVGPESDSGDEQHTERRAEQSGLREPSAMTAGAGREVQQEQTGVEHEIPTHAASLGL
jgi:hypothetical protein